MSQQQIDVFSKQFADRLRQLRGNKSKALFSKELGIKNPQTYQRYEMDRIPDPVILDQIARHCGKTVDWLLGREPGSVMKEIDAESEARFIADSRKNMTQRLEKYSEGIKGMLASMQRVNPEMRRKLKGMIIDLLDDFEVKCDADAPNVKIVAASETKGLKE